MSTLTRLAPFATLIAASLFLQGCDATDPYKREGVWRPSGVVQANLAAQLVDPYDLVEGQEDTSPRYRMPSGAVAHLWGGGQAAASAPGAAGAASAGARLGPAGGPSARGRDGRKARRA